MYVELHDGKFQWRKNLRGGTLRYHCVDVPCHIIPKSPPTTSAFSAGAKSGSHSFVLVGSYFFMFLSIYLYGAPKCWSSEGFEANRVSTLPSPPERTLGSQHNNSLVTTRQYSILGGRNASSSFATSLPAEKPDPWSSWIKRQ